MCRAWASSTPRATTRGPRSSAGSGAGRARREARDLRRPRGPQVRGRGDLPGRRLAEARRPPHVRLRGGRLRLQAHVAPRLQDRGARVPPQGGRRRPRGLPPGDRDAGGLLPGGRPHTRGGRARRAGLPRLPARPLEAPAHQQPSGAHQPRDKAQVARGADVPVGGVAGASGGRRHVRPGRGVVALEVLLGAHHVRAPRRAGRATDRGHLPERRVYNLL